MPSLCFLFEFLYKISVTCVCYCVLYLFKYFSNIHTKSICMLSLFTVQCHCWNLVFTILSQLPYNLNSFST
uniref:Uncharacterized protein n=1 Tax=Anguilla anguilla TaxID=7936 RepID=A0A0E9XGZ4_ANGAN